ncbi:WLM-domain-containing protein [Podospora conica]|nr:WLM-domain-containing protein [Schizothecium conicum]
MPVGIQRLNAKKTQPNDRIIFIKPLKGPDEAIAQDFLERIAAQCLPIMRAHHLSVTSLEEYPPNREFVGRNFNAGEVVQLVLKARGGRWLPFEYVQMVMMHELAHCKQMNHSRAFWTVRNLYAEQMRALWTQRYTGEGLWGRGALLGTGQWEGEGCVQGEEGLPEHLCGGTFRSRGRGKRKVTGKAELTSKERKERRILKKFGEGGVALGEDGDEKLRLEGKRVAAKPRVAGSKRGRELRAQAALARFEVKKEEVVGVDEEETDSGEEYEEVEDGGEDAVDLDGKRLVDGKGRGMVKVCEDEDPGDGDAQRELLELQGFGRDPGSRVGDRGSSATVVEVKEEGKHDKQREAVPKKTAVERRDEVGMKQTAAKTKGTTAPLSRPTTERQISEITTTSSNNNTSSNSNISSSNNNISSSNSGSSGSDGDGICSVCSFSNGKMAPTCAMCANVLHLRSMPGAWACNGQGCQGSSYRNAADCGVCGVCGRRKGT